MKMSTTSKLSDGPKATARYEALRALAVGQPGAVSLRRELTLLLRKGVAAWLAAWRQCSADDEPTASTVWARTGSPGVATAPLQVELAAVLATMALAHMSVRPA